MTKTPKLITANHLREYLMVDNDWTAHEVRDFFHRLHADGITLADRTDEEWMKLVDSHGGF